MGQPRNFWTQTYSLIERKNLLHHDFFIGATVLNIPRSAVKWKCALCSIVCSIFDSRIISRLCCGMGSILCGRVCSQVCTIVCIRECSNVHCCGKQSLHLFVQQDVQYSVYQSVVLGMQQSVQQSLQQSVYQGLQWVPFVTVMGGGMKAVNLIHKVMDRTIKWHEGLQLQD